MIELSEDYDEELSEGGDAGQGKDRTCIALKAMYCQPIALMLPFVPAAWVLHSVAEATGGETGPIKPLYQFVSNFLSIIPLAWVISESTEHLEKKVGPMAGTLLNQTFGNVVEIILSITAIRQGLVKLVQSSLLGAMLMNILGVLGLCFFVAGVKFHRKKFNQAQATYNIGLLSVSSLALAVPTGLAVFDDWSTPQERLALSRWVALCLFLMYCQWLAFNLCTHQALFDKRKKNDVHWFWAQPRGSITEAELKNTGDPSYKLMPTEKAEDATDDEDEDDEPTINFSCACLMLAIATVLVAFHCDWLVESINPVCAEFGVKKAFIATVLLPMVGNFSEVIAAVSMACKGKLDLGMGVAIGSATQIALCVIPVVVFIAWIYDKPLDLDFEAYQVKLLVISLLVTALMLLDGEANWLKGSLLVTSYVIMASSFFFIHDREFASAGEPPELIAQNITSLANTTVKLVMED